MTRSGVSRKSDNVCETNASADATSDKSDLKRRTASKTDTLETLYSDAFSDLSLYLRKAFGDGPPDPEDVAQDAFRRLAEQQDLSLIDNLRAFLWRTARNLVISHKRSVAARSKYDFEIEQLFFALPGPGLGPERVLQVKQQLQIIHAVLEKLPERRRKAFLWHRVDGLNLTDVGRKLGIDRRAVARHIAIAATNIEMALEEATETSGK